MPEAATAPAAAPAAPASTPATPSAPATPAAAPASRGAAFFQRHADKPGNTAGGANAHPPNHQQPSAKPSATARANEPSKPVPSALADEPASEPSEPTAPTAEAPKPESAKPSAPAELPAETDVGKMAPKQLRDIYAKARRENAELKAQIAKLSQGEKPNDAQIQEWKQKETDYQSKVNSYEERLRYIDYQNSEEFKTTYQQPYAEAFQEGRNMMKKLTAKNPETGDTVHLTEEHFDRLMYIQDPAEAAEYLDSLGLSGAKTQMVIDARAQCRNIQAKATKAEAEYKAKGGELEKSRKEKTEAEMKTMREAVGKSWQKHVSAPLQDEKLKVQFSPREGDEKGNQLLKEGYEASAKAFKVMDPMNPKLTAEEREAAIASHAEMFNKAAAYNRLQHWYSAALKRAAAAEEKLKGYEQSAPKGGDANGRQISPGAKPATMHDRLLKYADRS